LLGKLHLEKKRVIIKKNHGELLHGSENLQKVISSGNYIDLEMMPEIVDEGIWKPKQMWKGRFATKIKKGIHVCMVIWASGKQSQIFF